MSFRIIIVYSYPKNFHIMTLNDIRNRSGLLLLVIGLGMLGFIFMDLMNSGTSLFQKGQNLLLKLDGTEVTFTNFEKELEQNINIKYGSSFGSVNITQAQRDTERDLLWDEKIEEILLSKKFNQSGIMVGQTETWDLISGDITVNQAQLFSFFFRDQTESGEWNQYDPEMIQSWIEIGSDNPQWPRYLFFKNRIVKERQYLKYYNAIKKGLYATKHDGEAYYIEQTQSSGGKYIYIPTNNSEFITDPSEKEIKKYYKNNRLDFPNIPNRELTYFTFNLTASESDKQDIIKEMEELISDKKLFNKNTNREELVQGFENTTNIEEFINQHGDNRYSLTIISRQLFTDLSQKHTIKNDIIQPYIDNKLCRIGRVIESSKDSVKIAYLDRELYASDQTLNEIYSDVFDIINNNPKLTDLDKITADTGVRSRNVTLQKMDKTVPGLGVSRQIVRWAFGQEMKLQEPKFFDLESKYIIAIISNINEDETKAFSEVYDEIKLKLQNKKTTQAIVDEIERLDYTSINDIANVFNTKVNPIDGLRLNSDIFGKEGYNPGAVGAFLGSDENTISSPFISKNGVFVFQKEKKNNINNPTNFDQYQKLITQSYQSEVDLLLIDAIKMDKDITDNRFNFY